MSNIATPDWVIRSAKKLIYKFIYKGSDKITRSQASKPINEGGLNLPVLDDIVAATAVGGIKKRRANQDTTWAQFFLRDFKKLGGLNGLNNILHKKDGYTMLPFTRYICEKWQLLKNIKTKKIGTFSSTYYGIIEGSTGKIRKR